MSQLEISGGVAGSTNGDRPERRPGTRVKLPVNVDDREGYLWFPLRSIPDDATIITADLQVAAHGDWGGEHVVTARRVTEKWDPDTLTWDTRPGVGGVASTATVTDLVDGETFTLDVTTHVAAWVDGTSRNRGLRITTDDTTVRYLRSFTGTGPKPLLLVDYVIGAVPPADLSPDGGAVSVSHPQLTFDVDDDTIAVRVEIASDEAFADIVFDSGLVASTVGVLELAETAYTGIAADATIYWRAYAENTLGISEASDIATTSRVAKPTVTITSPTGDPALVADPTPPIVWDAPGQVAWRATINHPDGRRETSGWHTGDDNVWTPEDPLVVAHGEATIGRPIVRGNTATATIEVRDDVDRVATQGDPTHASAQVTYQLEYSAATTVAHAISANQKPAEPWVRLSWSSATVPDRWAIERDGAIVARVDAADVLASTASGQHVFELTDHTAPPRLEHTWRVLAVTETAGADDIEDTGPQVTMTPLISGVWLWHPDTGEDLVLAGSDDVGAVLSETSVIHTPLDADAFVRTFSQRGYTGTHTAPLENILGRYAHDEYQTALLWREDAAAGQVFRLVWGAVNIPVVLHGLNVVPVRRGHPGRPRYTLSLSFIEQTSAAGRRAARDG